MSSPKTRRATNASPGVEIEKHREEGNWKKCLELARDTSNRNEWEQPQLRNFITGEAKLELLLEEFSKSASSITSSGKDSKPIDEEQLNEARKCLLQCIEGHDDSPLLMDANLLLAKAAYISGNFQDALQYIRTSGIDHIVNIDKKLPPRVIKLIAESLSVKGMSLEKISPRKKLKFIDHSFDLLDEQGPKHLPPIKEAEVDYESFKTQSECLTKAAALGIRYIQIIDKQKGQYFVANLGHILETTILKSHHCFIRNGHIHEAIDYCRRMLNYTESQSILHIRQLLSKELSELLIKGVCRAAWRKPDCGINKQALLTVYYGNSIFTPSEFEEELMLLLMLTEALTTRNVVLERSNEFEETRIHSLNDVLLIQDLYTIVFTPFQQYFIENYERAMKFSYEVKHIWFQFALTLIESGQQSLRAFRVLQEVSRMDPLDPLPNLFAAKLCMTDLAEFDEAIALLNDALCRYQKVISNDHHDDSRNGSRPLNSLVNNIKEIYGGSNLLHRIHLLLGIAHALVNEYDTVISSKCRQQFFTDSIHHLHKAIQYDENGNDHLPFFHLGLHMANQRELNKAIKYSRISLLLSPMHLPSMQLLILVLTGKRAYKEALEVCEATLLEYPDHLILLYIKAHLQEVISDNGREAALMTAKLILKQWRTMQSKERKMSTARVSCVNPSMPNISYDTMSLRMEQAVSEVVSMASVPTHNDLSLNISDQHNSSAFEMQIWLMIIDLFLKLHQISEAEVCVNDSAVAVFGSLSHQLMYVKGLISKKKDQLLDAKIHFLNAVSINPKHAKALQQLGHTYYLLGNHLSADKYLKESLNVDSTLHETWSYMGLVLDAIGEHTRAFDCHQTAIELEETSPILPFSFISRTVLL